MPPIAILVALADPTRCRIIEILRDGPLPVHLLAAEFSISRPAISRHLRVLKEARLISEKKIGRENRYALHASRLKPVQTWLDQFWPPKVEKAEEPVVLHPAPRPAAQAAAPIPKAPPAPIAATSGSASPVFSLAAPKVKPAPATLQIDFDF